MDPPWILALPLVAAIGCAPGGSVQAPAPGAGVTPAEHGGARELCRPLAREAWPLAPGLDQPLSRWIDLGGASLLMRFDSHGEREQWEWINVSYAAPGVAHWSLHADAGGRPAPTPLVTVEATITADQVSRPGEPVIMVNHSFVPLPPLQSGVVWLVFAGQARLLAGPEPDPRTFFQGADAVLQPSHCMPHVSLSGSVAP